MKRFGYLTIALITAVFALTAINNGSSAKLKVFRTGAAEEVALAKSLSMNYLETKIGNYGINTSDLKIQNVQIDELSMAHTRIQQTVNGVPVFGGEAIVHFNPDGSFANLTDTLVQNVAINTTPTLTGKDAIKSAINAFGCEKCLTAEPISDMWVLRHEGADRLVYRVQLRREDGSHETSMPVYFIDANTNEVVWNYDNLQTAVGSGPSLYSGTISGNSIFTTTQVGATFYMEDTTRRIGTFDSRNTTSSVFRFTDTNNVWDATAQRAAIDAHIGLALTYDYYLSTHNRRGIDGNGGPGFYSAANGSGTLISSKVHYSTNYNNAFWNGQLMTYGDGNGTTFTPLTTIDICAHEVTHGVTERTARLVYSGQSGALNESMSDIFGAMVELYAYGSGYAGIWKVGEQAFTPSTPGDALRHMDNPHLAGNGGFTADDDPDHFSERYTGTADNGGVHINSGIPNKVFYLLSVGGTHHRGGTVTGIGSASAARIFYRALTVYMTSSTQFSGARTATLNAARDLFGTGSAQQNAVAAAWTACGV